MRVYIMTDLEGVAGVRDFDNWTSPDSRYYEQARELLTREVNAAIQGFMAAGATEFLVADGHGPGAVNDSLILPAAEVARGWQWPKVRPFSMDDGHFDFAAWVGQHPKAGTVFGHLCHTGNCGVRDLSINGKSVGEFGEMALCAGELGVRVIFASGDQAFAQEALDLIPGIETAFVKRGTQPDPGHNLSSDAYRQHNTSAIHLAPEAARERIRAGAQRALERAKTEDFGLLELSPPFKRVRVNRATATHPPRANRAEHPTSVIGLMNTEGKAEPIDADPLKMI